MKPEKQPILENKENDCRNLSAHQPTSDSVARCRKPPHANLSVKSPSKPPHAKSRLLPASSFKLCCTPTKNHTKQQPVRVTVTAKPSHFDHKTLTFSSLSKRKRTEKSEATASKVGKASSPSGKNSQVSQSRDRTAKDLSPVPPVPLW